MWLRLLKRNNLLALEVYELINIGLIMLISKFNTVILYTTVLVAIMPPPPSVTSRRRAKSRRAGLIFPISRVKRSFKDLTVNLKPRFSGMVFLTSVLEYLVAELLDSSGQVAKEMKKKMITPTFIVLAIFMDGEFRTLLRDVIIPGAARHRC